MKPLMTIKFLLIAGIILSGTSCGLRKKETAPAPAPIEAKREAPPLINPEELKDNPELAKWIERTTPGINHDRLSAYTGNFKHIVRYWQDSKSAPELSFGKNDNRFIYGGRYFVQRVTGTVRGEAYEGMGIIGYDNVRGEYLSNWYDSSTTGIMSATGKWNEKLRTLTERGTMTDFNHGKRDVPFRGVWQFIDPDHYTYELYAPEITKKGKKTAIGKEFKVMEIVYTREGK